jgi:hypothetical protein
LQLNFPLECFFVLARLHEDYIKLTLNQVVTDYDLDNEDQEAIVIQDEIIPMRNIYDVLCFHMWNNLIEDRSLIQLCDKHKKVDNEINLKGYI